MKARIRFTNSAEADLLVLWLTIAEENLIAADESLDLIQLAIAALGRQPEMGKVRPELANGLRSISTRTPYIIFYVLNADGLLVVRVLHHARDIDADYFF